MTTNKEKVQILDDLADALSHPSYWIEACKQAIANKTELDGIEYAHFLECYCRAQARLINLEEVIKTYNAIMDPPAPTYEQPQTWRWPTI